MSYLRDMKYTFRLKTTLSQYLWILNPKVATSLKLVMYDSEHALAPFSTLKLFIG